MTCKCEKKLIYQYLDKTLEGSALKEFEANLKGCPACQKILEKELVLDRAIRSNLRRQEAPEGLFEDILNYLPEDEKESAHSEDTKVDVLIKPVKSIHWLRWLAFPALVCIVFCVYLTLPKQVYPIYEISYNTYQSGIENKEKPEVVSGDIDALISAFQDKVDFELDHIHIYNSDAKLQGASLVQIEGETAVNFHYKFKDKRVNAYYMDLTNKKLPTLPENQVMDKGPVIFYTTEYQGHGVVICYHKWDNTACVIVSDMPMEEVLALMSSKKKMA